MEAWSFGIGGDVSSSSQTSLGCSVARLQEACSYYSLGEQCPLVLCTDSYSHRFQGEHTWPMAAGSKKCRPGDLSRHP